MTEAIIEIRKEKKEKKQKKTTETTTSENEVYLAEKKAKKLLKRQLKEEKTDKKCEKNEKTEKSSDKKSKKQKTNHESTELVWTFEDNVDVSATTHQQSALFMSENSINLTPSDSLKEVTPILQFSQISLPTPNLQSALAEFPSPTPIQAIAWPVVLKGHDFVGIAATGSGKT